jgi:RNA polymerase sigma factor (sigma-70 family)
VSERRGQLVTLRAPADEPLGDAGLVAACAAGDRAARGLLFERYVDVVHRFVAHLRASDDAEVDDVVQATFVAAFAAAARFRGAQARPWLLGIAAHLAFDRARREIRRKRALVAVADRASGVTAGGDAVLRSALQAALARLPEPLRAAVVMIDVLEERGADAARALGIPEGTLWRRVHEARQALRRALDGAP